MTGTRALAGYDLPQTKLQPDSYIADRSLVFCGELAGCAPS